MNWLTENVKNNHRDVFGKHEILTRWLDIRMSEKPFPRTWILKIFRRMNPRDPLQGSPLRRSVSWTPCLKSCIRSSISWLVSLSKVKAIITSPQEEPSNICHRHAEGCGILAGQGLEFVWRCTKHRRRLHTYGSGAFCSPVRTLFYKPYSF